MRIPEQCDRERRDGASMNNLAKLNYSGNAQQLPVGMVRNTRKAWAGLNRQK
jgi:hypothetical protein